MVQGSGDSLSIWAQWAAHGTVSKGLMSKVNNAWKEGKKLPKVPSGCDSIWVCTYNAKQKFP